MGYYYAKALGEDDLVSLSIKEQYLPNGSDSSLPSNSFSAIISLATKIDSLKAIFSVGKIPTGTKDPFALRRAVVGIIKIVIDREFDFDFREILSDFSTQYREFEFDKLEEFFLERIYKYFDANISIIKAVIETDERDLLKIEKKINALKTITNSSEFTKLFSTFKRVANIIKDIDIHSQLTIDKNLLKEEAEQKLFDRFNKINNIEYKNYESKLDALFGLKPEIDNFFDSVMVNDKNEAIKTNRKNLIASIYKAFRDVGDIKEISV